MVVDFDRIQIDWKLGVGDSKNFLKIRLLMGDFVVGNCFEDTYVSSFVAGVRRLLLAPQLAGAFDENLLKGRASFLFENDVSGGYIVSLGDTFDDWIFRAGRAGEKLVLLVKSDADFQDWRSVRGDGWIVGAVPVSEFKAEIDRFVASLGE